MNNKVRVWVLAYEGKLAATFFAKNKGNRSLHKKIRNFLAWQENPKYFDISGGSA